jgi:hypothetical protein
VYQRDNLELELSLLYVLSRSVGRTAVVDLVLFVEFVRGSRRCAVGCLL